MSQIFIIIEAKRHMKNDQSRRMILDDDRADTEGISILLDSEGYRRQAIIDLRTTREMLAKENPEILL